MRTAVVYVHGLWVGGWETAWLRARVARVIGGESHAFDYRSVSGTIDDHAAGLARFLTSLHADTLHLVAHSLGGIVILECFERHLRQAPLPPGRAVFLGTPVRGSEAAQRLARFRFGTALLGRAAREVLLAPRAYRWTADRDLGVIAGDLAVGFGRLMGKLPQPSDGTVMVGETDLPGAKQRLVMPVSHTGLVLSATVARQVAVFLRDGRFENGPAA
jgi:pimeloyl-ACP methyl ester carboxylesterase